MKEKYGRAFLFGLVEERLVEEKIGPDARMREAEK